MAAAARAVDLDARHAVAAVDGRVDRALEGIPETWPSRAALELRVRGKERLTAACTAERAAALLHVQRTGAGPFGSVFAKDAELFRRQRLPPLRFGLLGTRVLGHAYSLIRCWTV